MKKFLLIILIAASAVRGESETLYCDSISSPDQWTNFGGADKVESVSDMVDNNFIDEMTQGEIQRFTLQDPDGIGQYDQIDSIIVKSRMYTPSGTGTVARVNHIVSSTAYGTNRSLAGTWTDYQDAYSTDPDGGDWSLGDIINLKIEAEAVTLPILKRARSTRMYVVVFYTSFTSAYRRRINQQLMLMGD